MAFLIMAATARELTALAPHKLFADGGFVEMYPVEAPAGLFRGGRQVFFCLTGVGPLNAALAAGLCFGHLAGRGIALEAVLNIGLAGAYSLERMPLRSLCLVEEEIWPEYGLHDGHSVIARAFKWPLWRRNEENDAVYDRIALASISALGKDIQTECRHLASVRSITVAGTSASVARASQLWDTFHADLENMEGFAIAYACARAGIPCVEVRSIANKVGPRRKEEKDFDGALQALGNFLPMLNFI